MFTLKINLGNDAMQTTRDVAGALRRVAGWMETGTDRGRILDDNGNLVGEFGLTAARTSAKRPAARKASRKSNARPARKAPRSAAQKAATKKMLAANKRARR